MVRTQQITIPVAGSAGSAIGSAQTGVVSGRILAIHLKYNSQPSTVDVTVTGLSPALTVLTVSNANTDGWFYPRIALQTSAAVAITYNGTQAIYGDIPVNDHITVSVAQGNAGSVVATILYEC